MDSVLGQNVVFASREISQSFRPKFLLRLFCGLGFCPAFGVGDKLETWTNPQSVSNAQTTHPPHQ